MVYFIIGMVVMNIIWGIVALLADNDKISEGFLYMGGGWWFSIILTIIELIKIIIDKLKK